MILITKYNVYKGVRIFYLALFVFLFFFPSRFYAQGIDSSNVQIKRGLEQKRSNNLLQDSISEKISIRTKSIGEVSKININDSSNTTISDSHLSSSIRNKSHNPNLALGLSAVLPGAGQVYNHQAWKIPIVYAGLVGVGYFIYDNFQQMQLYKSEYLYRVNHDDNFLNPELSNYPTANIYNLFESYNKNFQLFCLIEIAVYGVNLLDAYVFGHLFDFDMENNMDLTLNPILIPNKTNISTGICLKINF